MSSYLFDGNSAFILLLLILSTIPFIKKAEAKDLYSDDKVIHHLDEIPTTFLDNTGIIRPYIAYAIGPEFEDGEKLNIKRENSIMEYTLSKKELKFGYSDEYHGLFIKIAPLKFSFPEDQRKLLVFNNSLSGTINIYRKKKSTQTWDYVGRTGSSVAYENRMIQAIELAIPLQADSKEDIFYFISRRSPHHFDADVKIISQKKYFKKEAKRIYGYMIYIGSFLSLILFNFLIYISLKDRLYLLYCLSGLCVFATGLTLSGMMDFIFSSYGVSLSDYLLIFTSLSLIASLFFASEFYSLKKYSINILRLQYICIGLVVLNLAAFLLADDKLISTANLGLVIDILLLGSIMAMISGAIVSLWQGNIMAKFYLSSWMFLFLGALMYIGHFIGFLPRNILTSNGVLLGNLLEMLVVSLGMAYKISILDAEKKEALVLAKGKSEYQKIVRVLLHDLSNPISLIQYYVNMKKKRPDDFNEKAQKAWEKINFGLNKMKEIILFHKEQEAHISRISHIIALRPISVKEIIADIELMFEEKFEAKGISLIINGEVDIDVEAEKISLINEVFNNILSNSIKFSPVEGNINIDIVNQGSFVGVCIRDNSKGFSDIQISDFLKNNKVTSTMGTAGEKGTGFGLYLVRKYMQAYRGSIKISNEYDDRGRVKGSCVELLFMRGVR